MVRLQAFLWVLLTVFMRAVLSLDTAIHPLARAIKANSFSLVERGSKLGTLFEKVGPKAVGPIEPLQLLTNNYSKCQFWLGNSWFDLS